MPTDYTGTAGLSGSGRLRAFRWTLAAMLALTPPMMWLAFAGVRLRMGLLAEPEPWSLVALAAGSAAMGFGAYGALARIPGVLVATVLGSAASLGPLLLHVRAAPGICLTAWSWCCALGVLAYRYRARRTRSDVPSSGDASDALVAPLVIVTVAITLLIPAYAAGLGAFQDVMGLWAITAMAVVGTGVLSAVEFWLVERQQLGRPWAVVLAVVGGLGALALAFPASRWSGPLLLGGRLAVAGIGAGRAHELKGSVSTFLLQRPALLIVGSFGVLSGLGGLLLTWPLCAAGPTPIPVLDALFTAVSASCVTGLTVVDTAVEYSTLGHVVILGLIQVGALGIMTLSAAATLFLGGSLRGRTEGVLRSTVGRDGASTTRSLLRGIVRVTFLLEGLGTLMLWPTFTELTGSVAEGLWRALFHAVSAFCNAGFALQSDSLMGLQGHPFALQVLAILVMTGGAGFGVLVGLGAWVRSRGQRRFQLHEKLVHAVSLGLLVVGFAGFLLAEWNSTLGAFSVGERISHGWFQSVTLRTAGFNSVDFSGLAPATVLMMVVWMFIGASPGSTGGGIKTTTVAVLVAAVVSVTRERPDAEVFGRRLGAPAVYRAAAIATLSALAVFVGATLLMLTQHAPFHWVLFEAVSAFGTVGLTLGLTPTLDDTGKLVVMALMLLGRTGPLTMALLFRRTHAVPVRYPEEEVMVG